MALVGDSPVSWKTKKQGVVSHSSAEARVRTGLSHHLSPHGFAESA